MRRAALVLSWFWLACAALAAWAAYDRWWRWRDCFNELGRCYDPISEEVYLEQAGVVWGGAAALCLALALLFARRARPSAPT